MTCTCGGREICRLFYEKNFRITKSLHYSTVCEGKRIDIIIMYDYIKEGE